MIVASSTISYVPIYDNLVGVEILSTIRSFLNFINNGRFYLKAPDSE